MNRPRPTWSDRAGAVYLGLRAIARREHRTTDELHQFYALEGLLARLAVSEYADRVVLKGGVLLAAFEVRRPTRDIDLQARQLPDELGDVLSMVRAIAAIPLDDGIVFDAASAEPIRDGAVDRAAHTGVRVTLSGSLASARLGIHVDVSVGDPVCPPPRTVLVPRLLGGHIALAGYPLAMVHAEKIVTMVERGVVNTRWRDFADVHLLSGRHDVAGDELDAAVRAVAGHRGAGLVPLAVVLEGYPRLAQARWSAWRRRQRLDDRLPAEFAAVVDSVGAFADPVLTGAARDLTWQATARRWVGNPTPEPPPAAQP